ncbi:MAG: class I SAM-dependent methyltransferase, partial [Pseudomonadota bacterium]
TRCLINLPSWDLQKIALDNIHRSLKIGGIYLMLENFIEGQANFNKVRKDFGLPEIPIREHNFFFQRDHLLNYIDGQFNIEEEVNISSTYYLMSRVIYSKLCSERGHQPDYFDDHHRFAAGLPFAGEFGPLRLICLRRL